ncbi:hypothetical protein BCV70DRAFT_194346 [Testicularia cyperi]|uniref:Mannosyltransferase n=1 Tax=Testicularia cyperi TaxID=1882483 RepID=A0A317XLH2_9BASI|nr:hypothetical protein BCV70DRAFT_194346 [Testicularia cyperi]
MAEGLINDAFLAATLPANFGDLFGVLATPLYFVPRTKFGLIYTAILGLRCLSAFSGYGYIHPDEWMQSGEAYFALTDDLGNARLTWEWRPQNAVRSPKALTMYYLLVAVVEHAFPRRLNGYERFLLQRANAVVRSLLVDLTIASVFDADSARWMLCLLGISSAATTFFVRPFSNSHEAQLVALCFCCVVSLYSQPNPHTFRHFMRWLLPLYTLGYLAAEGIFTRFTFAIFAAPIAIAFAARLLQLLKTRKYLFAAGALAVVLYDFVQTVYATINYDTQFYTIKPDKGLLAGWKPTNPKYVLAPLNAFLYNLKTDNVAEHGLHPRWLHVFVNFPMIVGVAPSIVLCTYGLNLYQKDTDSASSSKEQSASASKAGMPSESHIAEAADHATEYIPSTEDAEEEEWADLTPIALKISYGVIVLSLVLLSISPHQEPRFLLPLAFPTVVIFVSWLRSSHMATRPKLRRWVVGAYVVQHVLQMVFFSFLHQGGLVPALLEIDNKIAEVPAPEWPNPNVYGSQQMVTFIIWRTFTVPFHLMPHKGKGVFPDVLTYDSRHNAKYVRYRASIACDSAYIVMPAYAVADFHAAEPWIYGDVELQLEKTFYGHIDTDHWSEMAHLAAETGLLDATSLKLFSVKCDYSRGLPNLDDLDSESDSDSDSGHAGAVPSRSDSSAVASASSGVDANVSVDANGDGDAQDVRDSHGGLPQIQIHTTPFASTSSSQPAQSTSSTTEPHHIDL